MRTEIERVEDVMKYPTNVEYSESADYLAEYDKLSGYKVGAALNNNRTFTKNVIDEILKFYHVKSREVPENITEMNEQL